MPKKYLSLSIIISILIIGISGCNTTDDDINNYNGYVPPTPNLKESVNSEDAGKIMFDSVLKGFDEGDYPLYVRDFSEMNKEAFDERRFDLAYRGVQDNFGKVFSSEYLGHWVKGNFTVLLWKVKYEKTKDDILMVMYVSNEDDTYQIGYFGLK